MEESSITMEREDMNQYTGEENEYFMSFKKLYAGDIIEGKVISVNRDEVFVDIGYKSDGVLPASEIPGIDVDLKEKFKAGDTIKIDYRNKVIIERE
jgi:ribosomal protein S1